MILWKIFFNFPKVASRYGYFVELILHPRPVCLGYLHHNRLSQCGHVFFLVQYQPFQWTCITDGRTSYYVYNEPLIPSPALHYVSLPVQGLACLALIVPLLDNNVHPLETSRYPYMTLSIYLCIYHIAYCSLSLVPVTIACDKLFLHFLPSSKMFHILRIDFFYLCCMVCISG